MNHHVGEIQERYCESCETNTEHYLYHSGEWKCTKSHD